MISGWQSENLLLSEEGYGKKDLGGVSIRGGFLIFTI